MFSKLFLCVQQADYIFNEWYKWILFSANEFCIQQEIYIPRHWRFKFSNVRFIFVWLYRNTLVFHDFTKNPSSKNSGSQVMVIILGTVYRFRLSQVIPFVYMEVLSNSGLLRTMLGNMWIFLTVSPYQRSPYQYTASSMLVFHWQAFTNAITNYNCFYCILVISFWLSVLWVDQL